MNAGRILSLFLIRRAMRAQAMASLQRKKAGARLVIRYVLFTQMDIFAVYVLFCVLFARMRKVRQDLQLDGASNFC